MNSAPEPPHALRKVEEGRGREPAGTDVKLKKALSLAQEGLPEGVKGSSGERRVLFPACWKRTFRAKAPGKMVTGWVVLSKSELFA